VDAVVVVGGYHSGNTCRLAQVSEKSGLPTFHVETEKDLNREALEGMETIGVTAGASTPNWMIKNVVKEIEGIRGRTESSFFSAIKKTLAYLVLTNLFVAFGALAFAYAAAILSKRTPDLAFPLITFLYIYAMHVLNRFLDKGASAYNDPERASFLRQNRVLLIITGIGTILGGLAFAYGIGMVTFIALSVVSLLGIVYSLPLVPERLRDKYPYSKIKDIPGSRSLSEALAWVTLITVLPLLESVTIAWPAAIISFLIVFSISYVRSAFFDIFQVQGDLIVGTETLPIILGEKKALLLLKWILLTSGILLVYTPLMGLTGLFSYAMLIPLLGLSFCLKAYEKRWLYPGINFEALVESNFLLAGLVAMIWQVL
jgi:4-hydroxy-3-methylbut-2-enyl diphosphate reductase